MYKKEIEKMELCIERTIDYNNSSRVVTRIQSYNIKAILKYINIFGRLKMARSWVKMYNKYPMEQFKSVYIFKLPKSLKRFEFNTTSWRTFWSGWKYYYKYEMHDKARDIALSHRTTDQWLVAVENGTAVKGTPYNLNEVLAQLYKLSIEGDEQLIVEQVKKANNITT